MSDIQFRVDAVLGDTSLLQQQLQSLKTNLNLTINNQQALKAIQQVQQQLNQLKTSAKNINLGMVGNTGGRGVAGGQGSSGAIDVSAGLQKNAQAMQGYILQSQELVKVNGQITEGTNRFVKGNEKVAVKLKQTGDTINKTVTDMTNGANALNKLGMPTGTTLNTGSIKDVKSLESALNSANMGWNSNTHSIKQFSQHMDSAGNTITQFTTRQKSMQNGVEVWQDTSYAVSSADKQLRQHNTTQTQVLNTQKGLLTTLGQTIKSYAMYAMAMNIWRNISESISSCVNYVKDLNEAMVNIRVVTMETQEETERLLKTYNQMGQALGASTTDIASGAIDWLRQGFSQEDTSELVQDSIILSKLALIDSAEATEYLTSALKGYKLEAKDAIGVIDQLTSIDLEAATSAGDMAEALSRTANMARTTGFEMNEALGMIATVSEVTQNSASTIGNAMKTLLSRMSNVKAGVEIDAETGEALNDVEKVLNRVGIALRDNQGNWYDFYDVLDNIASRWEEFSDIQKSQITTALGGKQKPSATTYSNVWCLAV